VARIEGDDMIPTAILTTWLFGLLAFGLVGGSIYLARAWYVRAWVYDPALARYVLAHDWGWNAETALLLGGLFLLIWVLAGGLIVRAILSLGASRGDADAPRPTRDGTVHRLERPDGAVLQVESYGPDDGIPLVLTHGWGQNSTEWSYLKRQLSDRYRLIIWDLPGLGLSTRPQNRDYSLENLARHLEAVLELAGGRPAVLLGHSIGGMITLTFCRLFPEALGTRVAGLGLVHTTYTNPVRTTQGAGLATALERPLIVPLLYLTIWLSPLVWLMTWMSYLNGTAHLTTKQSGYAGTESSAQLEFATRFQLQAPPAVVARGMLGMLRYDASAILDRIPTPTLVITGDRDPVCRPDAGEQIGHRIPNARLVTLTPAKHMGLIEHHERFAQTVREFIQTAVSTETARPERGAAAIASGK
jgi:pimeloyl-ACP methyl ester carboxylesterase